MDTHGRKWLELSASAELPLASLREKYFDLCQSAPRVLMGREASREVIAAFDTIERDVGRTFSFDATLRGREAQDALRRVLAAYALYDPGVLYTQGLNFIAAFLLKHTRFNEPEAFTLLVRLMWDGRYAMRGLYTPQLPDVGVTSHMLQRLIWDHLPGVAEALHVAGVAPELFFEWYFTLFLLMLPPDLAARAWDSVWADGWPAIFRITLALLQYLEPHLRGADFHHAVLALKAYQAARNAAEFPEMMAGSNSSNSSSSGASAGGAGGDAPAAPPAAPPAPATETAAASSPSTQAATAVDTPAAPAAAAAPTATLATLALDYAASAAAAAATLWAYMRQPPAPGASGATTTTSNAATAATASGAATVPAAPSPAPLPSPAAASTASTASSSSSSPSPHQAVVEALQAAITAAHAHLASVAKGAASSGRSGASTSSSDTAGGSGSGSGSTPGGWVLVSRAIAAAPAAPAAPAPANSSTSSAATAPTAPTPTSSSSSGHGHGDMRTVVGREDVLMLDPPPDLLQRAKLIRVTQEQLAAYRAAGKAEVERQRLQRQVADLLAAEEAAAAAAADAAAGFLTVDEILALTSTT